MQALRPANHYFIHALFSKCVEKNQFGTPTTCNAIQDAELSHFVEVVNVFKYQSIHEELL